MKTVNQISVFLENKPGFLADFTRILYDNGVDMRALSVAETKDFGILRIIVNDVEKTQKILQKEEFIFSVTEVLATEIPDEPGGLCKVVNLLGEAGINLEYMYAILSTRKGIAYMILRVEENQKAAEVLMSAGISMVGQEELEQI